MGVTMENLYLARAIFFCSDMSVKIEITKRISKILKEFEGDNQNQ